MHVTSKSAENMTTAQAADTLLNNNFILDTCVSDDMVYGVAWINGKLYRVEVRTITDEEALEFFPNCLDFGK